MIQKKYSILVTNCFYSKINRTVVAQLRSYLAALVRGAVHVDIEIFGQIALVLGSVSFAPAGTDQVSSEPLVSGIITGPFLS